MNPRVTDRMNQSLTKPISDAEVKRAVKAIKSDSAPGSDGMTGHFFQKYWPVIEKQVTKEVKDFFDSGSCPADWNFTQICLLPKVPNPMHMKDLRPISLCSVAYKIISKILCTRLKVILPFIVSPTQGAFVAGRLISDNLLIAHEMIHGLKTNPNCRKEFIAIKTDMSKAYDRVEWTFLEALFIKMGFDAKWIAWIMACISSVSYTVLLNGQTHGRIVPERGIRQGDPLSPFLFILCAEALVHVMNRAEQREVISGMRLTKKCPVIQHLLFADDSLFLCRANLRECSEFLRCLALYGNSSGQVINFQKSAITFGKDIDPIMKNLLAELLHIENEGGDGKYLGLPECFSGSKQKLLAFIGEKLNKRLKGWFAKKLSLGGKEVLLKSIAMALPVYAMSCFRLTKHHCQKIMSATASFWWDEDGDKKKIHWIAWKKVCVPKEDGGLGFRDIEDFNQALLAKQAWRILNDPESLLARVYKGRYFSSSDFLDCGKGYRPSYAWRSLLFGRELLRKGLIRSIGNGRSTYVWADKWIMDDTPRRPVNKQMCYDVNLRVASLIDENGCWKVTVLHEIFPPNEVQRILSFTIGDIDDREIWAYTKNGAYTVKSGYQLASDVARPHCQVISPHELEVLQVKRRIWKIPTIPKIRMFLWRAVSGALAVSERLISRGIPVDLMCKLCNKGPESIDHVLFHCDTAQDFWEKAGFPLSTWDQSWSIARKLNSCLDLMNDVTIGCESRRVVPWLLWTIWKNRNSIIYANTRDSVERLVQQIMEEAKLWEELNRKQSPPISCQMSSGLDRRWTPPPQSQVKCNIHANWRNDKLHCGGSWIMRDHQGNVKHHARDAFTSSPDRLTAELRVLIWVLQSLRDLYVQEVVIGSDFGALVDALKRPLEWPKYRWLVQQVVGLTGAFSMVCFEIETVSSNFVAREIAKSVLRNGLFQSYLALGGPSWLQDRIRRESAF